MTKPKSTPSMGERIAALRTQCGMSQSALARAIGVSATAISKLESGETQMLRADHLLKIAAELGAHPALLVFGEDSDEYRRLAGALPDANSFPELRPRDRRLLNSLIQAFVDHCRLTGRA
ncbi:helix-turn-helix domain-containing protein [Paraburkholderia sp. EG304]|uniref:helix-turn-helix domain-containing protein n=1 Tax=Paraburkholderia sp. EG304 TaxID=3237015 RepID=UPI00397C6503